MNKDSLGRYRSLRFNDLEILDNGVFVGLQKLQYL